MAGVDPTKVNAQLAARGMASRRGPSCPRCKSKMIIRTRRSDGGRFWGCSQYPDCKGTLETSQAEKIMDQEALANIARAQEQDAAKKAQPEKPSVDKDEFLRIQREREKDSPW